MWWSRSRSTSQLNALAFAAVACLTAATDASASPSTHLVGLRAGTAQEAQQGMLKSGAELGLTFDRVTGHAMDLGIGLAVAHDPGGGDFERNRITIASLEAHARTSLAQRHPYVEAGLGYYWITREETDPGSPALPDHNAPGMFAGLGYEFRAAGAPTFGVAIGLDYHLIFSDIALEGGDVGDYYTFTATVRWGRRAP